MGRKPSKEIDDKKYYVEEKEHNEIQKLEQFYVNGKIDNMFDIIELRKNELVNEMVKYAKENKKCVYWSRDGSELDYAVVLNPVVVSNKFFKSIVPISCQEPMYNAEKLGMVYDYYCYLIEQVNEKIGNFPSSLTLFCKFAGITLSTLKTYKNSSDYSMRVIAEKIYDQISDENITMSQLGVAKERSTLFKLKSQNELVEKAQPTVHINITEKPDLERINERLNKYKQYAEKKK